MTTDRDTAEERIVDAAQQHWQQDEQELDADTLRALRGIRHSAIEKLQRQSSWSIWLPVSGAALAAALVATVVMWPQQADIAPDMQIADLDILAFETDLELLEELDFYLWLEEIRDENSAG
jgi:hypothetical protein